MGLARAVPIALFGGACACWIAAVVTGGARVTVLLIVPVVSGTSWLLALGTLFLFAAIGSTFLLLPGAPIEAGPARSVADGAPSAWSGGVVLVGPFPILLGRWRGAPRWVYWSAVVVGLVLLAAVFAVAIGR